MSGGFFRGTSADQDTRFSNKHAKLLKSQKFPPELDHPVDMTKVKIDVMKPWIAKRVTELLGFEDEVLINFIYGLLDSKDVNGKEVQISLTGFMEKNTGKFMKELWVLLLSAEKNSSGIPQQFLDAKEEETRKKKAESDRIRNEILMKKEKDMREYEQEKLKKMDGGIDDSTINSAVMEENSKQILPRISSDQIKNEKKIAERNGLGERSSRKRRSRSRSLSNSRSDSVERYNSRSVSLSPRRRGRSTSSERVLRSRQRQRRSITPRRKGFGRKHSPRGSISPSRQTSSSHYNRRGPSSRSYRRSPPSPTRRRPRSPSYRKSPSPVRRRPRSPFGRRSPSPARLRSPRARRGSPDARRRSSAVRRRSPSPLWRPSRSPPRRRSPSPVGRRCQRSSFSQSGSPSPDGLSSASPVRNRPSAVAMGKSSKQTNPSSMQSPLQKNWIQEDPSPVWRSPVTGKADPIQMQWEADSEMGRHVTIKKDGHKIQNFDSGSGGSDPHKSNVKGKRKHSGSYRKGASDNGSYSETEPDEKEMAKKRRREGKRLRKERRRRRHEERRRRREERRAEKAKAKSRSESERTRGMVPVSDGECGVKGVDLPMDAEDEVLEPMKLEIELRKKALESLRAKKGIGQ